MTSSKTVLTTTAGPGVVFLHDGSGTSFRMPPEHARNLARALMARAAEVEGQEQEREDSVYDKGLSVSFSWTQIALGVSYSPEEGHLCIIFPFLTVFASFGKSDRGPTFR